MPLLRYMGTKRHMASHVESALLAQGPVRPVVDLFSGMGSVVEALAPHLPVYANDFLSFAAVIAEARITSPEPIEGRAIVDEIQEPFFRIRGLLRQRFARRLALERAAITDGYEALRRWLDTAPHAGTSAHYARRALAASRATDWERFQLVTLYFSAGYFSTRQALELDSLRAAIEELSSRQRLVASAAWLLTAGRLINGPGHAAQYLRPNTEQSFWRMRRLFERETWEVFQACLNEVRPIGSAEWRKRSRVFQCDAHDLLRSLPPSAFDIVYADPPYTRDQYSRFYHVYETLCRYDYPGAHGKGRTPKTQRPKSRYSRSAFVADAFRELFFLMSRLGKPLILSYPSEGLLHRRGVSPPDLAREWLRLVNHERFDHQHSTLGGSKGRSRHYVQEHLYTFLPR